MNNVLKIAKKLKNFTLDDLIIMGDLDETLANATLNALVANGKIKQTGKYFEYVETQVRKENYKIIDKNIVIKNSEITMIEAVEVFLEKLSGLTFETLKTYKSIFNSHIIPFFKDTKLKNIDIESVQKFREYCAEKDLYEGRIKNILALLNQLIKYFQNEGWIEKTCVFEVRRLQKLPKRSVQILLKPQVLQLLAIVRKDYGYMLPIIEKTINEKLKLNDILRGDNYAEKERTKRKIRKDFFKIKQKLGLENYKIEDLRFSTIKNV